MSGAKKTVRAQREKQKRLQTQRKSGNRRRTAKTKIIEKRIEEIDLTNVSNKELSNELIKMKAITPYALAMKYNIKLSVAKDWLEILEKRGIIQKIAGSGSLKIYKFGGMV